MMPTLLHLPTHGSPPTQCMMLPASGVRILLLKMHTSKTSGEKTAVNKEYINAIGDEHLMRVMLTPAGDGQNEPEAAAARHMALFRNGRKIRYNNHFRMLYGKKRKKRRQLISHLTAKEAKVAALDKEIKSYRVESVP